MMKKVLQFFLLVAVSGSLLVLNGRQEGEQVQLEFVRFDLRDGRKLQNVVIRSYDAKSERVLLVADGKAITVPIALIYPPFDEQLKRAPESGSTISVVQGPTASPGAPRTSNSQGTSAPRTAAGRSASQPAPAVQARAPAGSAYRQPGAAASGEMAAHRSVALDRARKYFAYEFQTGSNHILMLRVEVEAARTQAVTGWLGRYRTEGRAYYQIYDSRGRSMRRATSTFEVLTERKPGEEIEIIEFMRKS